MMLLGQQTALSRMTMFQGGALLAAASVSDHLGFAHTVFGALNADNPQSTLQDMIPALSEALNAIDEPHEDFAALHASLSMLVQGGANKSQITPAQVENFKIAAAGIFDIARRYHFDKASHYLAGQQSLQLVAGLDRQRPSEAQLAAVLQHPSGPRAAHLSLVRPGDSERTMSSGRRIATVLFLDIARFTDLSETMESSELVRLMNLFYEYAGFVIKSKGGFLIKTLGDGFMASFNGVKPLEEHAARAVESALDIIHQMLPRFNKELAQFTTKNREALTPFSVRVGVHTGLVAYGMVGAAGQKSPDVMGANVNLAARLESLKLEKGCTLPTALVPESDRLLISKSVKDAVDGRFVLEPLGKIVFQGRKGKAVETFSVVRRRSRSEIAYASPEGQVFFGRQVELQGLKAIFSTVSNQSKAAMALVSGEAGQGKSYLVNRFLAKIAEQSAGQLRVLHAKGIQGGIQPELSMMADLLRAAAEIGPYDDAHTITVKVRNYVAYNSGLDATEYERVSQLLAYLVGAPFEANHIERQSSPDDDLDNMRRQVSSELKSLSTDPKAFTKELKEAAIHLIESLSARSPVVLYLDDIQWADGASVDFIQELLTRLNDHPVLVLGTRRLNHNESQTTAGDKAMASFVGEDYPFSNISLEELSEDTLHAGAQELLAKIDLSHLDLPEQVQGNAKQGIAQFIATESGSSLYLLNEMAKAVGQGWIRYDLDKKQWQFSEGIDSATTFLEARVDSLSVGERKVIDLAAVIADRFDATMLESLGISLEGNTLADLEAQGVIVRLDSNEYVLRHDKYRETVYGMMDSVDQRKKHLRVAEHYDSRRDIGPLKKAFHHEKSGNIEKALDYYQMAAEEAFRNAHDNSAFSAYQQVITLSKEGSKAQVIGMLGLASVYNAMSAHTQSQQLLDDLQPLLTNFDAKEFHAQFYEQYARALIGLNEIKRAVAVVEKGLDLHEAEEASPDKFKLLALRGEISAHNLRDFQEAKVYIEKALIVAKSLNDDELKASAFSSLSYIAVQYGNYDQLLKYSRKAEQCLQGSQDRRQIIRLNGRIGVAYYYLGQYQRAIKHYEETLIDSRENSRAYTSELLLMNIAAAARELKDYDTANRSIDESLTLLNKRVGKSGPDFYVGGAFIYKSLILMDQNDFSGGLLAANQALSIAEKIKDDKLRAVAHMAKAQILLREGKFDESLEESSEAYNKLEMGVEGHDLEIRLTHARALRSSGDIAGALQVIREAVEKLAESAQAITDGELRNSYLNNIAVNREISRFAESLVYENATVFNDPSLQGYIAKAGEVSPGRPPLILNDIEMGRAQAGPNHKVGESYISGAIIPKPLVEVLANVLNARFAVPKNSGGFEGLVYARDISYQSYLDGDQPVANIEAQLVIERLEVLSALASTVSSGLDIKVEYRAGTINPIQFKDHFMGIVMKPTSVEMSAADSEEISAQFGEIEFILYPIHDEQGASQTGLALRMGDRPFTQNPDVFLAAFLESLPA